MKKKLLMGIIVASSFITQAGFAQTAYHQPGKKNLTAVPRESFEVLVLPDANREKIILEVNNPFGEKLNVTVEGSNSAGFRHVFTDSMFRKRIDMSEAEDGGYVIIVSNGTKTIRKRFTVSTTTEVVRNIAVKN